MSKILIPLSIQKFRSQVVYDASKVRQAEHISDSEFERRFPEGSEIPATVNVVMRGLDGPYLVVEDSHGD